jgi:hypothetical protein
MRSYWRGSVLALMAAGFCMALGAPTQAGCVGLSGTADGFDKETAVSRAQLALADYVKQYKAEKRLRAVTVSPCARRRNLIGAAASARTCSASTFGAAFTSQT